MAEKTVNVAVKVIKSVEIKAVNVVVNAISSIDPSNFILINEFSNSAFYFSAFRPSFNT